MGQELEAKARNIKAGLVDMDAESRRVQKIRPIIEHLDNFEAELEGRKVSANHLAYTVRDCRLLIDFAGLENIGQLDRHVLNQWVNSLHDAGKDSLRTTNRRIKSVSAWLKFLQRQQVITFNPLDGFKKAKVDKTDVRRIYRNLSRPELIALLFKTKDRQRRALYRFAAYTGLRLNECREVRVGDIALKPNLIEIPAESSKSGRKETVPIHRKLKRMIRRQMRRKGPDDRLLAVAEGKTVNKHLEADLTAAKVDTKNTSFHGFRHSFCTMLVQANVHPGILQKLARHRKIETTLAYYVHLSREDELHHRSGLHLVRDAVLGDQSIRHSLCLWPWPVRILGPQ